MKRLIVITAIAILLPVAGAQSREARMHSAVLKAKVCPGLTVLHTRLVGWNVVAARPFVAGQEINTVGVGRSVGPNGYKAVEGSGYGILVRIISTMRNGDPLTLRIASARGECIPFKLIYGWR